MLLEHSETYLGDFNQVQLMFTCFYLECFKTMMEKMKEKKTKKGYSAPAARAVVQMVRQE